MKNNGKRREYKPFYTYEDYRDSVNPEDVRNRTQLSLQKSISKFFSSQDTLQKYVITNEGLGKSETILNIAREHHFIYAFHTTDKLDETEKKLIQKGIKYSRILNIEQLLEEADREDLISFYNHYISSSDMWDKETPSFYDFVSSMEFDRYEVSRLMKLYKENTSKTNDNNVVITTIQKLKILLSQDTKIDKTIVFDEFSKVDWMKLHATPEFKGQRHSKKLKKSWGTTSLMNSEIYMYFYKHKSFIDMLHNKKFLILSTERTLIEQLLYDTGFSELKNEDRANGKFDYKLKSNVHYILLKSTKKEMLPSIYDDINSKRNDLTFISNSLKNRYRNNVLTHLEVKGLNNLSNEKLVIIGTNKNETEIKTHLMNSMKFYSDKFSSEIKIEINEYLNTVQHIQDEDYLMKLRENKILELLYKKAENLIQQTLVENEVSQSIGRNAGFRENGSSTTIVLKGVQSNTNRRTLDYNLNYISSNVVIAGLSNSKLTKIGFYGNSDDDLTELYELVPMNLRMKIKKHQMKGLDREQVMNLVQKELNNEFSTELDDYVQRMSS